MEPHHHRGVRSCIEQPESEQKRFLSPNSLRLTHPSQPGGLRLHTAREPPALGRVGDLRGAKQTLIFSGKPMGHAGVGTEGTACIAWWDRHLRACDTEGTETSVCGGHAGNKGCAGAAARGHKAALGNIGFWELLTPWEI